MLFIHSQCFSSKSNKLKLFVTPALLTIISSDPNSLTVLAIILSMSFKIETLHLIFIFLLFLFDISFNVLSRAFTSMSAQTTL